MLLNNHKIYPSSILRTSLHHNQLSELTSNQLNEYLNIVIFLDIPQF